MIQSESDQAGKTSPLFSLIMPTYNRRYCIEQAILSVLSQTYDRYELIIVDDGSTDDTDVLIRERFQAEIDAGKIRYIRRATNQGVCICRNLGLELSQNEWIGYLDSDNTLHTDFLSVFAKAIRQHPEDKTFYANWHRRKTDKNGIWYFGPFSYEVLKKGNYIDMGIFVHHRSCYEKLGGFDTNLKRLVDWELILRYTKEYPPVSLPDVVMEYDDLETNPRITQKENYRIAYNYITSLYDPDIIRISVVIVCYQQEAFITEAIESVLKQQGQFWLEIIVSDDGSTDATPTILAEYAEKYPTLIRNLSQKKNMGISKNYKRCFAAARGQYIAVLEGDDFWLSQDKLSRQSLFLENYPESSMVFNAILTQDEQGNRARIDRQQKIFHNRLSGYDLIADRYLNPIINLSSCMFRTQIMQQLPDALYTGRLSEIPLAFYLEQLGTIGFIARTDSVYRIHSRGVWQGKTEEERFREGLGIRERAFRAAAPRYRRLLGNTIYREYVSKPNYEQWVSEKTRNEVNLILETANAEPPTAMGIFCVKAKQNTDKIFTSEGLEWLTKSVDRLYLVVLGEMSEQEAEAALQYNLPTIKLGEQNSFPTLGAIQLDYLSPNEPALYDEVLTLNLYATTEAIKARSQERQERLTAQQIEASYAGKPLKKAWRYYRRNGIKKTVKRFLEKVSNRLKRENK